MIYRYDNTWAEIGAMVLVLIVILFAAKACRAPSERDCARRGGVLVNSPGGYACVATPPPRD